MSRVLIFRHVPFEGAGLLEDVLREHGVAVEHADLYRDGTAPPDTTQFTGLVFMGGPMSVNDPLPYLRVEEEILRAAAQRNVPVLGICLGAQLLAKAFGGTVRRNPVKEIGWYEIAFTPEAQNDALFRGLDRETVFHWHGETFDLPDGALRLAGSDLCVNQAFRLGSRMWGMQFHLEITPAMILDWCVQDENCGDVRDLTSPLNAEFNAGRMITLSRRVFGAWCELLSEPHSI